jgi:hypothetical protein
MSRTQRTIGVFTALLGLAPTATAVAQDLLEVTERLNREVAYGHSAAHYGMAIPIEQRASIRAVLSSVQLDRLRQAPSVAAAGTYLFLQMFAGGGGAPTDIAEPRSTVEGVFQRE